MSSDASDDKSKHVIPGTGTNILTFASLFRNNMSSTCTESGTTISNPMHEMLTTGGTAPKRPILRNVIGAPATITSAMNRSTLRRAKFLDIGGALETALSNSDNGDAGREEPTIEKAKSKHVKALGSRKTPECKQSKVTTAASKQEDTRGGKNVSKEETSRINKTKSKRVMPTARRADFRREGCRTDDELPPT
jgi:hypothetical protein